MADAKKRTPKYDACPSDIRDMRKVQRFTFTLNNPTELDEKEGVKKVLDDIRYKRYVFQKEIAPNTGTPHLQGVYEAKAPRTLSAEKKYWAKHNYPGIHLERAVSSWENNVAYVTKTESRAKDAVPVAGNPDNKYMVEKLKEHLKAQIEYVKSHQAECGILKMKLREYKYEYFDDPECRKLWLELLDMPKTKQWNPPIIC